MNDTTYLNGIGIGCMRALFAYDIVITFNRPVECSHDTEIESNRNQDIDWFLAARIAYLLYTYVPYTVKNSL